MTSTWNDNHSYDSDHESPNLIVRGVSDPINEDNDNNTEKSETDDDREQDVIEQRLRQLKVSVQKLTKEAYQQATITEPRTNGDENDDPTKNYDASFQLGLALFGQSITSLEETIQTQVSTMENELRLITKQMKGYGGSASSFRSRDDIERDSHKLQTKINFLKYCSIARSLVDQAVTISTPALCPASDEPDYVAASKYIVQANQALSKARNIIDETTLASSTITSSGHAAYTIIESIQVPLRRKKVELIGIARTLFTTCVTIKSNSISVRAPNSGLRIAYDIFEIFSSRTSTPAASTNVTFMANTDETEYGIVPDDDIDDNDDDDETEKASKMINTELGLVLRTFTRRLHEEILNPVVESMKANKSKRQPNWKFVEVEENTKSSTLVTSKLSTASSLTKGPVYRLEWTTEDDNGVSSENSSISVFDWKNVFEYFQRILCFVSDRILLQRKLLNSFVSMRILGKPDGLPNALNLEILGIESTRFGDDNGLLLEPLVQALEETCIPEYLPNSEIIEELKNRGDHIKNYIKRFITELASHGFNNEDGTARLTKFAQSLEQGYVANRRCYLINYARDLLVKNDYHNTVQVGEDVRPTNAEREFGLSDGLDVFKLHKAAVSDTAYKLLELCRKTMDEAVEYQSFDDVTTPALATLPGTLYKSTRDMLDMFRSIIPVVHGYEISTVPRTAAVMHNDCVYFAFNCLILGLQYKDRFATGESTNPNSRGALLKQTCMFVDMVPLFRDLADRSFGEMLDVQARQVVELVGERIKYLGQSLSSDEILPEWSQAETAVRAGLYHLRHLSNTWKPILSYGVFNKALCYLADVIFTLLLDQIMSTSDISSSSCQFINTLFNTVTKDIESNVLLDEDKSSSRVWNRFAAIGKFMDMSILDIQNALSDGLFLSVTSAELAKLVVSCFDDSPKRQNLLKLLDSTD